MDKEIVLSLSISGMPYECRSVIPLGAFDTPENIGLRYLTPMVAQFKARILDNPSVKLDG